MKQKPLIVADIFCGAGGLSAGFKEARAWWLGNAGERLEIAYGVDNNQDAIDTFRAFHFSQVGAERAEVMAPCKSIKEVTVESILAAILPFERVDVLIGGPSCQGVSPAGLRNPDDERNQMLLAFIRLVKELSPKWFVMENVPGLTHANNLELLAAIFKEFESIPNYRVTGDVLLAADYGVPQLRHRLFIIGTNTLAPIRFPLATHTPPAINGNGQLPGIIHPHKTVKDAFFDLAQYKAWAYDEDKVSEEQNISTVVPPNHYYRKIADVNRERIATILPGQDWRYMPIRLLPERYFATRSSDQKGAYGRLSWNWPAYTITNAVSNVTAGSFTHPEHDRVLSVREAARLQSFSDSHVFYGSLESQYRQVGNAVPPKLAQAIAEAILYCHYKQREAKNWGKPGRLNLKVVTNVLDGKAKLPTMTPRYVHPLFDRRPSKKSSKRQKSAEKFVLAKSVWDMENRPSDPRLYETRRLRKLAEQPSHYRAAKRARAIVQFIDGIPKKNIVKAANVSEASVRKWVNGYFAEGLDGWRAYHTSFNQLALDNPKLADRIKNAITRVRRTLLSPSKNGGEPGSRPKRLYMNSYLLKLIERFGKRSVDELTLDVEEELQVSIGTIYVGDLLAICDVVLYQDTLEEEQQKEFSCKYTIETVKQNNISPQYREDKNIR